MPIDPLSDIDPAELLNVPRLSAKSTAALARAIIAVKPEPLPPAAEVALKRVSQRLYEFEQALTRLRRSLGMQTPAQEVALDQAADGAWVRFRGRLDDWVVYERPGFAALADHGATKVDYAGLVEQAKRARELRTRLLTLDGVNFLRLPFPEQAEAMRSILNLIDEDKLAAEIDELVGEDMLPVLRDLQEHYERMVSRRAERSQAKDQADNLRLHQIAMQRALRRYAAAMYGLYDDEDPKSGEWVYAALRPILSFRERSLRNGGAVGASEDELGSDALEGDMLDDEIGSDATPGDAVGEATELVGGP